MRILWVLIVLTASASAQINSELHTLLVQLAQPKTTQQAASKLITMSQTQAAVRTLLSDELPAMLLQAKDLDVVRSEAVLSGDFKLESTVPSLGVLLDRANQIWNAEGLTSRYELRDDPVGRALFEIGEPALPALSTALENKKSETRRRAIRILLRMNTPKSRELLVMHLPRENDADLRNYLIANKVRAAIEPEH